MSVLFESPRGCVLDACSSIDYPRCLRWSGGRRSRVRCEFRRQWFQMCKSHFSVSGSAGPGGGNTEDGMEKAEKRSKKRKRKHRELNQGEIDSQAFHEKIRSVVLEGTKSLVDSARSLGYLKEASPAVKDPPPCRDCGLAGLCNMAKELPLVDEEEQADCAQPLVTGDGCTSHLDLFSRVTENEGEWAKVVPLMGEEYVVPPHAAFLLSDFTRIHPLLHSGSRFDLIVLDPPWENKSVKRSCRYTSLPSSQLKRLPIPRLASPNALVVTWVTNRPSHLRCVCEELYPHWGVEVLAEWYWVKVTTAGEFVFPLDSKHKKPYEVLVLGRYRCTQSSSEAVEVPVEDQRLVVSVPSALHSQKPSLSAVLKPYVAAEAKCLELFARNLQPGWTSWGNEVLRFQHTSFFTVTPADPEDEANEQPPRKPHPPSPPPPPPPPPGLCQTTVE